MTLRFLSILGLSLAVSWGCQSASVPDPTPDPVPAPADASAAGSTVTFSVRFEGWDEPRGQLVAAIYRDAATFDAGESPVATERLDVDGQVDGEADGDGEGDAVVWTVELAPGLYALKVFLDLDSDGELDRGDFGVPSEPYGFSNNARGKFGPPSWSDARFELVAGGSQVVTVR